MEKFIEDTTAITQEQEDHKRQVASKIDEFERIHSKHKTFNIDADPNSVER